MVWVGRDLKAHPVSTLCHGQGHLPPDQAAQGHIQLGFEHLEGGLNLITKNLFLISNLNLPS